MRITGSAAKKMKLQHRMLDYADIPEDTLVPTPNEFFFITIQKYHSIQSSSNQSEFMYPNRDDSLSVVSFEEQSRYRLLPPPSQSQGLHYLGSCNGPVFGYTKDRESSFVRNAITKEGGYLESIQKLWNYKN
ncbi:hypothetical protein Syun_018121 [Stephania yunnanensis]|uniref:Uncharacterized protein n=1 Tax=Stephania yunnanensis TaxID=152371 RepID=A0AAP0NVW9_9MAGN